MPPSAAKQKRLAEKAAKTNARVKGSTTESTGPGSDIASSNGTPLTGTPLTSRQGSHEDLTSMAKLAIATDRCVSALVVF